MIKKIISIFLLAIIAGCGGDDNTVPETPKSFQVTEIRVGTISILEEGVVTAPTDKPIVISFSVPIDRSSIDQKISLKQNETELDLELSFLDSDRTISANPVTELEQNTTFTIEISTTLIGLDGEVFSGLERSFNTINPPLEIKSATIDGEEVDLFSATSNINNELSPEILVHFSEPIQPSDISGNVYLITNGNTVIPDIQLVSDSILSFQAENDLDYFTKYRFYLSPIISYNDKDFDGYQFEFYTKFDSSFKFPEISDEELLTKVQEQTFKYFWDFGHPVSGMARERNTSGETVTSGGSGFGLTAILVGIERGFITREEGIDRLETIVDYLTNTAQRYHGVWAHWMNGSNGTTIPFSANDDGGDLVETAFVVQGLLTVRQYLNSGDTQEAGLIDKINTLWEEVEWDWYTQGGQNVLYWHWSENVGWEMNHQIRGWNEALIIYVLAASSPTHTISKEVYDEGWARSGGMVNGGSFYDIQLPLGSSHGGPLFFSHYSFMGLDPRNLEDQYANYWDQNVAHSRINRAHCVNNPGNYLGYSEDCWGLTASDGNNGYFAHSPTNDRGVITPTAAISSIPYTPEESMAAIRHFYYLLGDKMWGEYGFYDAFNPSESWYATSYIAIDQGPIVCMIENHRTGLLWDLFMSTPEIQSGLTKLGFTY